MSKDLPEEIVDAKRNATAARARVDTDVAALQARLNPKTLAQDAMDSVRGRTDQLTDTAVETARKRPAVTALAGGTVALLVLRKPIRGIYRLIFKRKQRREERELPIRDRTQTRRELQRTQGALAAMPETASPNLVSETATSAKE
jgi:hypothetical protein